MVKHKTPVFLVSMNAFLIAINLFFKFPKKLQVCRTRFLVNDWLIDVLLQQDKADLIRPKRKYEKKPKVLAPSAAAPQQASPAALPVFSAKDLNQYDFPSSDEEPLSQVGKECLSKDRGGM